jgi:hypothetical protein
MPSKRQAPKSAAGLPRKQKRIAKQEHNHHEHSFKLAEAETSICIPEVESLKEDPYPGMIEVDFWPSKRTTLWEDMLGDAVL